MQMGNGDTVYKTAKWISEKDYRGLDDALLATKGDIIEIHGKHDDGDYVVKGTRESLYFWAKPEDIELIE